MIYTMRHFWLCVFGPRLYKIHRDGPLDMLYSPGNLEKWGDHVIQSLNVMWNIGIYASPIVGLYLYKKDYMDIRTIIPFLAGLGVFVTTSLCLRAYGRATNPQYREFIKTIASDPKNTTVLRKFDFDFDAWPVDFTYQTPEESKNTNNFKPFSRRPKSFQDIPLFLIGEIAVRTFALKLIYPGSISLLQLTVSRFLLEGRIKLVETYNGKRYKLRTKDSNDIDCMFVDKRKKSTNGSTLVICSEGNAGFYEIGIMVTPLDAGYSVLGWNHPGFACSTGKPYPLQEQNAFDTIIQFAIRELGFVPENIILYGWSIGCYSIAWAAAQYPDVKGIILDATFDDILPLAQARMPPSWKSLVREVVREHVNLNIAEILEGYSGPIKLIRRTLDEIICLEEGKLSTNRGNDLLVKILTHRYPDLLGPDQINLINQYLRVLGPALSVFISKDHPGDSDKNKKVIYLAGKFLANYESSHCTPLPAEFFQIPRDLTLDEDFVYT